MDWQNGMSDLSETTTIISNPYKRSATQNFDGHVNTYKGLRIHTLRGLHEHVAGLISEYVGCSGAAVDLGAGSGALAARLNDMGLAPTAVDYVEENFQLHDTIKFLRTDLNGGFADIVGEQFDLVTAVEIIEHLENPRHFLRQAAKLCKPGVGRIILTTPNIDSPVSKAIFCRFGNFSWFADENYVENGHITPLSHWQIRKMFEEIGLDVLHEGSFGNPFEKLGHWPKIRFLARMIQRLSIGDPSLFNEVYFAVLAPTQ